jgi:hypothetical protein
MEKLSGEAFSTQLGTIRLKQFIGYGMEYANIRDCKYIAGIFLH